MKNLAIGSLLAAIVLFFWGFLFWAVGLGDPHTHQGNEEPVLEALNQYLPEPGVYQLPDYTVLDQETFTARHRRGPLATIFLRKAGAEPGGPMVFVLGFLHMLAACLLIGLLLQRTTPVTASYSARVTLVALVGAAGAVWSSLNGPIWWYWPWSYGLKLFLYDFIAFVLAGLVLAAFIRPPKAAASL